MSLTSVVNNVWPVDRQMSHVTAAAEHVIMDDDDDDLLASSGTASTTSDDCQDYDIDDYLCHRQVSSASLNSIGGRASDESVDIIENNDCDDEIISLTFFDDGTDSRLPSTTILEERGAVVGSISSSSSRSPPVVGRPPSSAGSEDSGFVGLGSRSSTLDVSSDDDENVIGVDGSTTEETAPWPLAAIVDRLSGCCDSPTPSVDAPSPLPPPPPQPPRCREVVSVLRPVIKQSSMDSCLCECMFSVDLTGRADVTFTIEALDLPPLQSTLVPPTSAGDGTAGSVAPRVDEDDAAAERAAEGVDQKSSQTKWENRQQAAAAESKNGSGSSDGRRRSRSHFGATYPSPYMLSGGMTSLVPGFLIVPPPALGYIVLKPVNGTPPVPGEYFVLQRCAAIDARPVVNILPAVVAQAGNGFYAFNNGQTSQFTDVLPPAPKPRKWVTIDRSIVQGPKAGLRVMTYNVLAKKLATADRFHYCPEWMLSWDYRKSLLLHEITSRNADVIALQEVELFEYMRFFQPELEKVGYAGVFALKSRARTMSSDEQLDVDGCAIFYRKNKFDAVSSHVIEFNSLALRAAVDGDLGQDHDFLHRVMSKDNVGLAVLLQTTSDIWSSGDQPSTVSEPILVATAHLFWDPDYPDVKLIQTMLLTQELQRIAASVPQHLRSATDVADNLPPVILVGDFNALPDSGVVSFLRDGQIRATHADFCGRDYASCLKKLDSSSSSSSRSGAQDGDVTASDDGVVYRHNLHLQSVDCRIKYTNYTSWFRGVIDHVFYSSESNIRPVRALQGLPSNWLRDNDVIGLPTADIPSDHLPLVVDFWLTPRSATAKAGRPTSPEVQTVRKSRTRQTSKRRNAPRCG